MFCSIWNFIKRHRRKFVFTGFIFGGGWLVYKYLQKRLREFRDGEDKEYMAFARRQHHFDSNQRTCNMTVLSMVPNVREMVVKVFNTEKHTAALKSNPSNKFELWEELKIMSLSRSILSVYGCCIMSLLLRVKLNVIGGYIYLDSAKIKDTTVTEDSGSQIPQSVQEKYLSLIKHFISEGLPDLATIVEQAVKREFSSVSLKERMSYSNMQSLVTHIRERVECGNVGLASTIPTMPLSQYMLPAEQVPDFVLVSQEDIVYEKLVTETRDVLESTDFHTVLQTCLDRGFARLLDGVAEHYKRQMSSESSLYEVVIPVAKLIPVISSLVFRICSDAPNPFIQEQLLLDEVKTFSANVYEAFSQDSAAPT
ncbi:peroxisomal biogenesis factor 3-like [Haliotis asinina]|uniref:peroxisomal biogenesis factor 3-like n=1 Tax=Haliotis asinina TaxID=109174 RepID=UPI003532323E